MKYKTASLVIIFSLLLPAFGPAPAVAEPSDGLALIQISWQEFSELTSVQETGVPVYAKLTGKSGNYLLAGAKVEEIKDLENRGLRVKILDTDLRGAIYYLAQPAPNKSIPHWDAYGVPLLEDSFQVLLRTTSKDAARLLETGAKLVRVTFDPKPVFPSVTEDGFPAVIEPDPLIQAMIDQVDSETVLQYDRELAGELPVWIDGEWYTIPNRSTYSGIPIDKTTSYVGQFMTDLGLNVEYHEWGGPTYPNVIGEIPGLTNPQDIFIIGGHLDDVSGTPGADDNASGSVATLIAADILSQFQWGCTLRFALWTGEEQGLLGSHAYAQRAFGSGENILGYLNLDMIAWNTISSPPGIDLYYSTSMPPTLELAQLFADTVDAYNLNLIPDIRTGLFGGSDHQSFWDYGYTSILGIEDNSDFNPYYHGPNDTPANLDLPYFTEFIKASLASFAHMSDCLIPSGIGYLDGTVSAADGGAPVADADISMDDGSGHTYSATSDPSGYYTRTLLTGAYTVTTTAFGYLPGTISGVEVFTDSVTTQDFSLASAPVYSVSGQVTEAGSGTPLDAQIEFLNTPVTVWTDPAGFYQAYLPQGEYTMRVSTADHRPEERDIVVDQNQVQDFALEPLPCILLVDDDNDSPDVTPFFSAALDNTGYDYDIYDAGAGGGDGPDLSALQGYQMVFWYSGDKYGSSAGPNAADEAELAAYLDGGGALFLSSQDYLYDFGLTGFGQNYLGIGTYSDDTGGATRKFGFPGDPIGDGLGPYPLSYPGGFSDYGDMVNPGASASIAFRSGKTSGKNLDIDKDGGAWQTVFFGTSWVPVYNYSPANGEQILGRVIEFFGGCGPPSGTVHIGKIQLGFRSPGANRYLVISVLNVLDQDSQGVEAAAVAVEWTLPDSSTRLQQVDTNPRGIALFRILSNQSGVHQLCVTDVTKSGYLYDPGQNGETCDTINIP